MEGFYDVSIRIISKANESEDTRNFLKAFGRAPWISLTLDYTYIVLGAFYVLLEK